MYKLVYTNSRRTIPSRLLSLVIAMMLCGQLAVAQSVISFPKDRAASIAVVVRDLSTGEDIVSENPHKSMLPASTMKCITTAAAMEAGLDTLRFESKAYIRGNIDTEGVLHGNLVIRGNGDPTIESSQFPDHPSFLQAIASAVKNHGIKEIEGMLEVDASNFPDDGPCDRWEVSDLRYDYGAGLYSLNYKDNSQGSRSMANPGEAFLDALDNLLMDNGIATGWDTLQLSGVPFTELCQHQSPPMNEILHNLMVRSDNLFAEGVLRRIVPGQSRQEAIRREMQLLSDRGVNFDVTEIYDGSGLSRMDRVTASVMADLLQTMATKQGRETSYSDLFPRVGKEGTVKSLLTNSPLAGQLALKSGSMSGVHCYAGYKLDSQGNPTHAVVILINDFHCPRSNVRQAIENFLKKRFE